MCLDWNNINRSSHLIDSYFFYPFYCRLSELAKENRFIRLAAPFIGIIDGIVGLSQATATIAEAAIKGVGNLLRGVMFGDIHLLKGGALQILLGVGLIGVLSVFRIISRVFLITTGMLIDPAETSKNQMEKIQKELAISSLVSV